MYRYWQLLIEPILRFAKPSLIIEVGAGHGQLTSALFSHCVDSKIKLCIADPNPKFDIDELIRKHPELCEWHPSLALNALFQIGCEGGLIFLKGDPNWYTTLNSLRLIEKLRGKNGNSFPIILIGGTSWPYARRDAYIDPSTIPSTFALPYRRKGVRPGQPEPVDWGGLNPSWNHALYENELQNGVLTAVEDFLAETKLNLHSFMLPIFGGITVLATEDRLNHQADLNKFLSQTKENYFLGRLLLLTEQTRIEAEICVNDQAIDLQRIREQHVAAIDQLSRANTELATQLCSTSEYVQALATDLATATEDRDQAQAKVALLEEQWRANETAHENVRAAKDEQLRGLNAQLATATEDRDQAQAKVALLEEQWRANETAHENVQAAKDEQLRGLNGKLTAIESVTNTLREDLSKAKANYSRVLGKIADHEHKTAGAARKLDQLTVAQRQLGTDMEQLEKQVQVGSRKSELPVLLAMARRIIRADIDKGNGPFRLIAYSYSRWRRHGRDGSIERLKKEYSALRAENPSLPLLETARDIHARLMERATRCLAMTSDVKNRLPGDSRKSSEPSISKCPTDHHTFAPVHATQNAAQRTMHASSTSEQHKLKITALVITWDVGHNPLGRSYMLAEVLDRVVRNVVLVGFQFPRYGDDVWEPVRHSKLPVISLPGENLPEFLDSLDRISQRMRPDIVIACKPRLPSVQLGALIKQKFGCPLIVDIDDHELSFFKNAPELTSEELARMPDGVASGQVEPYSEIWTRLAQHMCKYADERIVSNVALHKEFGGTIVPHVRDEHTFDPALFDSVSSRVKYGVPPHSKVVLFFGTPRHHKGIDVLADAVGHIDDDSFRLVIVGTTTDRSVTTKLDSLAPGRVIYLPNQPFSVIPEIVVMADVICLPQDEDSPISQFQLPAKAIDAVAMGIPLLVSGTPPLMQLVQDGVAKLIDRENLPEMLRQTVASNDLAEKWRSEIRSRFLASYSYGAASKQMRELIERALRNVQRTPINDLSSLQAHERRVIGEKATVEQQRAPGIDIVVFWKQNDTGLYGRRSDMVIRYLASRPDVRRVVVFDAPISEFDLLKRRDTHGHITQDRLIYIKTYEKVFGKLDTEKISYNVFVFPPGTYHTSDGGGNRPQLIDAYVDFIEGVFEREGFRSQESVFWIYPKNFMAPELVDRFSPAKVVVDVVDDHRAWPGVSAEERDRLTKNYRETLARAQMAFVNCEPMVDSMREFFPAIRMVQNGCDQKPPSVQPRNDPEFDAFMARGGKTIGFVGNLEQKIDISLVAKIAERFHDCQIVLLGSTHANPQVLQLKHFPNVRLPGVVPYEQIGAWLSRFDVGIIPHLDLDMTQSMNPLKLYVYLSWRVPVVSTEIYNIDKSSQFVRVARTHNEFLEHVASALEKGRMDEAASQRYIDENSWEERFRSHVDELLAPLKEKAHGN